MKKIHIGKRVFKTSIAVSICLGIHLILMIIEGKFHLEGNEAFSLTSPTSWYTPFFASIATVYAMQANPRGSISQAKLRSVGSVIGGYYGAVLIFIFEYIYLHATGDMSLDNLSSPLLYRTLLFVVTSIGIVFLIPFICKMKKNTCVFIACLTYLSVTVSIRNGGMEVFLFATNRILSTILGVLISLAINNFPFFKKKNKDVLFLISLDNDFLGKDEIMTPYCKYKINELLYHNCLITFMTTGALSLYNETFNGVDIKHPLIILNGCALYYPTLNEYDSLVTIDNEDRNKFENLFLEFNVNYFSYVINEKRLFAYYESISEEGALSYYEKRKNKGKYDFVEAKVPSRLNVTQYVLIEKDDVINIIVDKLKKYSLNEKYSFTMYKYEDKEGYSFLKINSKEVNKAHVLEHTDFKNYKHVVCICAGRTDIEIAKKSSFSMCLFTAPDLVKNEVDLVVNEDSPDKAMHIINKLFYAKNIENAFSSKKNNN